MAAESETFENLNIWGKLGKIPHWKFSDGFIYFENVMVPHLKTSFINMYGRPSRLKRHKVIIPLITLIIDPILLEVFDIVKAKYILKYY